MTKTESEFGGHENFTMNGSPMQTKEKMSNTRPNSKSKVVSRNPSRSSSNSTNNPLERLKKVLEGDKTYKSTLNGAKTSSIKGMKLSTLPQESQPAPPDPAKKPTTIVGQLLPGSRSTSKLKKDFKSLDNLGITLFKKTEIHQTTGEATNKSSSAIKERKISPGCIQPRTRVSYLHHSPGQHSILSPQHNSNLLTTLTRPSHLSSKLTSPSLTKPHHFTQQNQQDIIDQVPTDKEIKLERECSELRLENVLLKKKVAELESALKVSRYRNKVARW